jgi:hypothetical protein
MNVDARGLSINNVRGAQTNNHFSITMMNDQPGKTHSSLLEIL